MLNKLKSWLARPNNNAAKLAKALHYKSPSTIYNWIKKGRIPDHVRPFLKEYLKNKAIK